MITVDLYWTFKDERNVPLLDPVLITRHVTFEVQ